MKPTARLRALLSSGQIVVAPFVWDAFLARLAVRAGFEAVYMTGFGTAAARGFPDVGLLTMTEMVANASCIAGAVDVPVIADADTGYGNPVNVRRTVREYERANVAAIHIEDQVWPKKCGFFEGKQVIPVEDMTAKVRAACDARTDSDFVIIARTDALAAHGWDEAAMRARRYREAGADLVFVDGIRTVDDLQHYARELADLPKVFNGQLLPVSEVAALGFSLMLAGSTLPVVYQAVLGAFMELRETGTVTLGGGRFSFRDMTSLLGLPEIQELERKYRVGSVEQGEAEQDAGASRQQ